MGAAALRLSCLATRDEARTREGRDDAAGAESGASCGGMVVVLLAKTDSWPMFVVPPPLGGEGDGCRHPPPILSGHPRGGRTREGKGPYRVGHVPAPPLQGSYVRRQAYI